MIVRRAASEWQWPNVAFRGDQRIGASVDFGHWPERLDQILFNESQSRVILTVGLENAEAAEAVCTACRDTF